MDRKNWYCFDLDLNSGVKILNTMTNISTRAIWSPFLSPTINILASKLNIIVNRNITVIWMHNAHHTNSHVRLQQTQMRTNPIVVPQWYPAATIGYCSHSIQKACTTLIKSRSRIRVLLYHTCSQYHIECLSPFPCPMPLIWDATLTVNGFHTLANIQNPHRENFSNHLYHTPSEFKNMANNEEK